MHYFQYKNQHLYCEDVALSHIADQVGTPCYVYSAKTIRRHARVFRDAIGARDHLICYAVKANSNLSILKLLAEMGFGFDIVSQGELFRVIQAGGDSKKVVFSGVGKTKVEMRYALERQILSFNVESAEELKTLNEVASSLKTQAPVSLRVNPDINPKTHPYISTGLKTDKFGIPIETAKQLYNNASAYPHIQFTGIDCHIGSQMLSLTPILDTLRELQKLILALRKQRIFIEHLNLGGGLGIRYHKEIPPTPKEYISEVTKLTKSLNIKLIFEPGRSIMGNAGILLTRVLYTKTNGAKNFIVVDAGMNDQIRPALYQAYQDILPVDNRVSRTEKADVVGPICESGDFLGKERQLMPIQQGELLAMMSSGAYGFVMSSNYNTRPRAAEVLIDGNHYQICRRRETLEDLVSGELL